MGFSEFLGNPRIVSALRGMFQRGRVPSALLFTGPRGIGNRDEVDFPRQLPGFYGPDLPYNSCDHCSAISVASKD